MHRPAGLAFDEKEALIAFSFIVSSFYPPDYEKGAAAALPNWAAHLPEQCTAQCPEPDLGFFIRHADSQGHVVVLYFDFVHAVTFPSR